MRLRIMSMQIAEGGFSFVYEAQEVFTLAENQEGARYAVKKVPPSAYFNTPNIAK